MASEIVAKIITNDGAYKCARMDGTKYYIPTPPDNITAYHFVEGNTVTWGEIVYTSRELELKNGSSIQFDIQPQGDDFYCLVRLRNKNGVVVAQCNSVGSAPYGIAFSIGFVVDDELKQAGMMLLILVSEKAQYREAWGELSTISALLTTSAERERVYLALKGANDTSTDPYDPDPDPTEPNPDPDPPTEPIPVPDLPDISATDTGFLTLYNPTVAQLRSLANYMWSDLFSLDTLKKLFADPMDAIIGCAIVPCDVPSGGTREVTVGNIGTGVSMTVATSQYQRVQCGSVRIPKHWDGYMDYSPYTKLQIFLPYIGFRQLNIDECMGKSLGVEYHIDCLTGACTAYVTCNNSVFYEYSGQCSVTVPFSGSNWNSAIQSAVSVGAVVGGAIATVASGGAAAPAVAAASATTVGAVVSNKEDINKSGSMGGGAGILGNQKPFICLIRPNQCVPANQNKFTGYPSYRTVALGSISGYTVVQEVHLENISATDAEKMEIESKLKSGVIL